MGLADAAARRLARRPRVTIRDEQAGDREAIRRLLVAAFGGEAEAKLVDALRADGDLAVALVADDESEIVGHVALSPLKSPARALALAPVAVTPSRQRQGIGSALIEGVLRRARTVGCQIVFVVGEPEYYARFGFTTAAAARFECAYAGPYFMALCLSETPVEPAPVVYSDCFAEL